jgi:hypothetical protein
VGSDLPDTTDDGLSAFEGVPRRLFGIAYRMLGSAAEAEDVVEEANARQLATRARQHVTDGRRARVSNDEQKRLLHAFIAAAQNGDLGELERLFVADVLS